MALVALLIDRTFDDDAFRLLFDRLRDAGHETVLVGPHHDLQVDGREGHMHLTLDATVEDMNPQDVDAVILPRGFRRDHLRTHERALNFLRDVYSYGKPVGVLHDDAWLLVRAESQGRGLSTWPAIKRDLVIEPNLLEGSFEEDSVIKSNTADVGGFCDAFLAQLEKGPRTEPALSLGPDAQTTRESPHPVD